MLCSVPCVLWCMNGARRYPQGDQNLWLHGYPGDLGPIQGMTGFPLAPPSSGRAPPSSGRASPSSGGRRSEPQRHRRKFSDVSVTFQFLAPVSVLRCWSCLVDSYTACHLVTPSSSAPMAAARLGASSSFQLDEAEPALSSSSSSG